MTQIQTENTPFFELLITKLMKKSLSVSLYKELNNGSNIRYTVALHSSGQIKEGTASTEERAFSSAIAQVGYDQKNSVYNEIRNHYQVHGVFHKIGTSAFSKIVKRAIL